MTGKKGIAPHEAFELHELLTFKNVYATKSSTMSALVKDDELKMLLRQDFDTSQAHIRELQSLMKESPWASDTSGTAGMGGDAGDNDLLRKTSLMNH